MKSYDLICFDVDGTLIEHPSGKVIWEVLNEKYVGNTQINQERYRQYHAGEITYEEWVELDVTGWLNEGVTKTQIIDAVREFNLIRGARETVEALKERGYNLAVISGTLDIMIDIHFPDHPFDDIYMNKLFFENDGSLTAWEATPFDLHGKPVALKMLVETHKTTLERSAFIGDGDNDIPLLGVAGYFIAFNSQSAELKAGADHVLHVKDLTRLLDFFP